MKRGYLWLDWVELGCRGWDLEPEGAALDGEDRERCSHGHEDCYAHLDRQSLQVLFHGCRDFHVRVINDLIAAGMFKVAEKVTTKNITGNTSTLVNSATAGPQQWAVTYHEKMWPDA